MKYFVKLGDEEVEVLVDGDTVTVNGETHRASLSSVAGTPVSLLRLGNEVRRVVVRSGDSRGRYTLWLDGFRFETEALDERARTIRELTAGAAAAAGPAPIVAPMPGMIVRVSAEVGDQVQPGQGVVVMEAMKMENELRATSAGTVRAVLVTPGTAVEKGAVLLELD
ncbi:MAG TPA: biotin/lipoyl-containing protein [Gemmatimonadaceae bacterium]|nr:biotin/lipoyl-containing protein [Gemmatimonadaceae bacterium]